MILGFDHLALSTTCMQESHSQLVKNGYQSYFLEMAVVNQPAKTKLLSHYQNEHHIGYFRSNAPSTVAIELIDHGKMHQSKGPYQWQAPFVEVHAEVSSAEADFWVQVFNLKHHDDYYTLHSILPHARAQFRFIPAQCAKSYLNSEGYTCAAFLTNTLSQDILKAKACGATDITEMFHLEVNNKPLRIAMFRTPGGAICELIQVIKNEK